MLHVCADADTSSTSTTAASQPTSRTAQAIDEITHSPQISLSDTSLDTSTKARKELAAPSANVDAMAEHLAYQAATSLTTPDVPPFLTTPWPHRLHWEMPPQEVLADIFQPVLVRPIQSSLSLRNKRCFCAVVFTVAQQYLRTFSTRNLIRDYPTNMANCLSVLTQIMAPMGVKVFVIDCERSERLHGRRVLDLQITKRTFAEHISEFIEQLPRLGRAAYFAANQQLHVETADVKRSKRMRHCMARMVQRAWHWLIPGKWRSERMSQTSLDDKPADLSGASQCEIGQRTFIMGRSWERGG